MEAKKESVFYRTGQEPLAPSLWELRQAEDKIGSQRVQINYEEAEPQLVIRGHDRRREHSRAF